MSTVTKEELHKKVLDRKDELVSLCQDLTDRLTREILALPDVPD